MSIQFRSDAAAVVSRLGRLPKAMARRMAAAIDRTNQFVVGYIQREKLTNANPPYLNVRTNRLRGSVRAKRAKFNETGITSSIGTNVKYAGVHEYGFNGTVQVAQFKRDIPANRFGKGGDGGGTETVREHSRRVDFKARHMFEHGVEENEVNYRDAISDAILEAWREQ